MARFFKDRSKSKGQAPGSLILIGNQKVEKTLIHVIQFDSDNLVEYDSETIEKAYNHITPQKVTWINIYGIHDLDLIKQIGELFNYPSLLLENIVNTDVHPNYKYGDTYNAFILKMLYLNQENNNIEAEQITLIHGENYLLTIQERKGDVFNPVRERIRNSIGRIRLRSNDYLTYALMDTIVDNYTFLIEDIGSKVEDLEDRIFLRKDTNLVEVIYNYKTELNFLRKAVRPVKDLMALLIKSENSFFQPDSIKFLQHLFEQVTQSSDTIELYNNMVTDQLNIYNSNVSNSMNEVMKVLTIFASIFIPLTFMAGIYGMNFEFMPELSFKYSYPIFGILCFIVSGILLFFFRKKRWL